MYSSLKFDVFVVLFSFKIEPQVDFFPLSLAIEPYGGTYHVFSTQFIWHTRGAIIFYVFLSQESIFDTSDNQRVIEVANLNLNSNIHSTYLMPKHLCFKITILMSYL